MSTPPFRRALGAGLVVLGLTAPAVLAPSALAGPRRAQFTYTFTATQQQWAYDNQLGPSECQKAPARGSGTQKATFTDKGRVEVTSDLARNVKRANFNITQTASGLYDRQGTFLIERSKRGICAEPDLLLGTAGCGQQRSPLSLVALYTGGVLEVTGRAAPYVVDGAPSCPFMFTAGTDNYKEFREQASGLDNDLGSGLLSSRTKVAGPQFFKRKVVLRGAATRGYQPTDDAHRGFFAQTKITWTLTLKPKR